MRGGRAPKKGTREAEKITRRKYHPMTSHELQQACRSRQGRRRKGTLKSTAAIFPLYHCSLAAILLFAMRRSGLDGWRVAGQAVQPPDFPPTFPSPPGWLGQALAPGTNKPSTIDSGMVEDIPPECEALLTQGRHLKAQSLPHILQGCSTVLYNKISDALDYYTHRLAKGFSFCINDPIMDRNAAFDFSVNMTFLGTCFQLTGGGILDRVCGAGEFDIYLKSILEMAKSDSTSPSIVTKNCNDSTWPKGCESGWSSSLDETEISVGLRLYKDPSYMPSRKAAPLPCCEGFFCPMGLSCMIPCPLGAYCPKATLNEATGLCEPYNYRVSPGRNITCGGANFWADYLTSRNLFCPAGQYCPTTTSIISCNQGHYCRQGSVAKNRCFQLVSCDANAKTQNIKTYGAMLIVTLALILLIFYKCSDQVMHIQDRRKAKAREKAVRQVQESLYAADRWKKAANAMKRVTQMISRMSSVNVRTIEETKVLEGADVVRSHEMHHQDLSNTSKSIEVIGSGDISSYQDLTECGRQVSEEDLYDPIVIPVISASTDGKDKVKPKLLSSRSQIMRYAYNRIEKEKVIQNKKLGWEDVLVYAGQPSGRERLKIEIEFQDLCIILKGIRKMILCDVTGKLSPGRVTAVMGPSGAGKTTFLNALAGKAYNSKITGRILINGAENPIHSYKKIIGFVPQDDIVHGNLTVEENLWFSASYRLPVNMPKAETVLVVEHIIESLGLQSIRNSKVGTVEKRGISGGQRKRVNVGLEMVMEPSLLILDEPTSGLDSTSSQLVLKALRREASVGVNVGVVLHQPSYGLFRMFDDVMFLAKGGKTVYLGPVDQVENYFASMKFVAPERINPPDHFMDVLEGIAKPIGDPTFDPKTLPIAWINHKGYKIPVELQKFMTQTDEPKTKINIQRDASGRESGRSESFMQELWREFAFYFAYRWDEFKSTFNMVEDNSQRTTPGFYKQFKLIFRRVAKQRFQEVNLQLQDYIILLLAGAFLGALSPVRESNLGSSGYSFTIIALSLLCMIASLRTFSNEKLQYWRESASGINRVSYFLAKDIVDNFNILLKPLIYLSMFYFFNYPRSTFLENYMVTLMLVYAVTGIAYIFSITMESGAAQLWSVFFPVISTLIVTRNNPTGILKIVSLLTYARWAQEAYVIANAKRYSGVWLVTRCFILGGGGYRADHWVLCLSILAGIGFFARAVALLCLVFCNRNRQK